jgi:hypothetical protein
VIGAAPAGPRRSTRTRWPHERGQSVPKVLARVSKLTHVACKRCGCRARGRAIAGRKSPVVLSAEVSSPLRTQGLVASSTTSSNPADRMRTAASSLIVRLRDTVSHAIEEVSFLRCELLLSEDPSVAKGRKLLQLLREVGGRNGHSLLS